jgi:hypothetical protein
MDLTCATSEPVANVMVVRQRSVGLLFARIILLASAFLLALTTARNADLWAHLASGRQPFTGFGSFGSGMSTLYWLDDILSYLVFSALGGTGLVVGKALVVAATALVMVGRHPSARTILAVFLACLALGGWLPLDPVCVSYLFLALTVRVINRRSGDEEVATWRGVLRSHRSLLVCYVIWANVDPWCLLGVALILLQAVSQSLIRIMGVHSQYQIAWRLFAWVLVAVMVSFLPANLLAAMRELRLHLLHVDPSASPFHKGVWTHFVDLEFEGTVPLLAFWLLVGVSISSFLAARRIHSRDDRWQTVERLVPWLLLLGLAAIQTRFVPFFVIVCAVTSALNFRAFYPHAYRTTLASGRWSPAEYARLVVQFLLGSGVAIVLLGSIWAGWLQAFPHERRNWTVEPDPSLVLAAQEVNRWYENGLLGPDQKTVFLANEGEDIFAWFAPASRIVSHSNASKPGQHSVGSEGVQQVREALLNASAKSDLSNQADLFQDPQVCCVVLSDPNRVNFTAAVRAITGWSNNWVLAYLRGRVAVYVRASTGPAAHPVNLTQRAFGLKHTDHAPSRDEVAFTEVTSWWEPFVSARSPRSLDRDEAVTYLLLEDATRDHRMVTAAQRFLAVLMASLVGSPMPAEAGWAIDPRVGILTRAAAAIRPPSEGPPPVPFGQFATFLILTDVSADHYLAVRAARRGIAASPRDAAAYEALGEAYLHLLTDPLDNSWSERFSPLRQLRLNQTAAAFHYALALEPTLAKAHLGLATVYLEKQFFDLALSEFRDYQRYGRLTGQPAEALAERIHKLETAVEAARQTTDANAANLAVLDRAQLARRNGLGGLALEVLLKSDRVEFGAAGIVLELELLLAVGRVGDAREWLAPELRDTIGTRTYDWLSTQSAVARGDYAEARSILTKQIASSARGSGVLTAKDFWQALDIAAKEIILKKQNAVRMGTAVLTSVMNGVAATGRQNSFEYQSRTEGSLLLALLALEEGDMNVSLEAAESVRKMWDEIENKGLHFPSVPRTILTQLENLICHD